LTAFRGVSVISFDIGKPFLCFFEPFLAVILQKKPATQFGSDGAENAA
jgi:hypothetical protein